MENTDVVKKGVSNAGPEHPRCNRGRVSGNTAIMKKGVTNLWFQLALFNNTLLLL